MKSKKLISVIAVITMIAILGSSILLQFGNVYAQKRLPGLDSLISEKTSDTDKFQILEIVEDEVDYVTENQNYHGAEIGFYINGNEPFSVDSNGNAVSFETTLAAISDRSDRLAYVEGLLKFLEGKYTTSNSDEYPLQYSAYADEYFLTNPDNSWTRVDFDSKQYVQISGEYVQVGEDEERGDYTKSEDFVLSYDENGNFNGDYVEDFIGFSNVSDQKAYDVTFVPYNDAPYKDLGVYVQAFNNSVVINTAEDLVAALSQQTEAGKPIYWVNNGREGDYTSVDLNNYVFVSENPEVPQGNEIVKGTTLYYNPTYQYAGANVEELGVDIPFYAVESYTYTFYGYEFTGGYGSILKDASAPYRPTVEGEIGTHVKGTNDFIYSPGTGDYNFVEDKTGTKPLQAVEVNGFYYQGGFTNNNWFREKVFLADENDKILNLLPIEVRTLTVEQFYADYAIAEDTLVDVDMVVINGSANMFYNDTDGIATKIGNVLTEKISQNNMPCIINIEISQATNASTIGKKLAAFYSASATGTAGSAKGSIYWYTGSLFNASFATPYEAAALGNGFADVISYINQENTYLELRGEDPIFETEVERCISQSVIIQYILSVKYQRNISDKSALTILEIEPCKDYIFELNTSGNPTSACIQKIRNITGYTDKKVLPDSAIKVVQMTTAEFVGKIHDLNGQYDFIYIGMQTGLMNTDNTGKTVYNDSMMNGLVYTSTGDYVYTDERLTGLLDSDYVNSDRNNLPHARDVYGFRYYKVGDTLLWKPESDRTINGFYINRISSNNKFINVDKNGNNLGYNNPASQTLVLKNQGTYRYSGNDITQENVEQLLDYVNAGYPIILDKNFAINGNKNNGIDTTKIDNSTFLYEFLTTAIPNRQTAGTEGTASTTTVLNKDNVFLYTDSGDLSHQENLQFYLNLPKLKLTFYEEASDGSYTTMAGLTEHYPDDTQKFLEVIDGQYYLNYTFSIEDEASASVLDTKYEASIFVDINSDGKFSRQNEKMQNLMVYKTDGTGVPYDELVAGETYTVRRKLPDAFRTIVTWKFEVNLSEKNDDSINNTNSSSNQQSLIRQAQIGYSKIPVTSQTETTYIKVLQILSDEKNSEDTTTWNLQNDASKNGQFKTDLATLSSQQKISIEFVTMHITEYQNKISANANYLNDQKFDMLILGFSDVYEGFDNAAAVNAIFEFIEDGKSVLFSHDTTSFVNYAGEYVDKKAKANNNSTSNTDSILQVFNNSSKAIGGARWGYLLNQIVRDELGMDRYGITDANYFVNGATAHITKDSSGKIITKTELTMDEAKTELTILLKKGEILTLSDPVSKYNPDTICASSVTVAQLIEWANKEVAYVVGSNKTQAYPETQGYTYMTLNSLKELLGSNFSSYVNSSNYPGYMNLKSGSGIENFKKYTFGDWLLDILGSILDLILGTDGILNNLKNVYNGAFDQMQISNVNKGQITEYPFDIPDNFTIGTTHPQYYQLDLATDKDGDGESDIVVWYCMSEGKNSGESSTKDPYNASPNDVRNNYYIYSIGNVFYTGAGHSTPDNTTEKRLFLNTIVAAYNAAVNDPSVTILEKEDIYAAEMSSINLPLEYSIQDSTALIEGETIKFHYSVYDDNFVSDNIKELSVQYFVEDPNGTAGIISGVKVSPIDRADTVTTKNGTVVSTITKTDPTTKQSYVADVVNSGNAYTVVWRPSKEALYNHMANNETLTVYVKVTSEFIHKGELKTLTSSDKLIIKKTNLFELD